MLAYCGVCGDITYAYGVFLPAIGETLNWSRSVLSGPYTVFIIVAGILGPVAGITVSRFGARKSIIFSNIIAVLGLLGMSQVRDVWQVYLFFSIMAGLGIAFGEFIPTTTVVNNWFIKRRSLAMGLLFASGGLGGFALPPLITLLISSLGWRWAWVCLAGIHLLLTVVMGGILIRSRPEDIGQVPDGIADACRQTNIDKPAPGRVYQTAVDWKVRDALRTPALWLMIVIFSATWFAMNMLTTHQVAYLQDLRFSPMMSATALGLTIGMSIIGRLICGALGMRFEGRYLAIIFLAGMALGIVALIYARGIAFVYLYSILTGIGFGGMVVLMPNLFGAYFGRTNYSQIIGWTMPIATVASAGSPALAGFLYDITGRYFWPFAIAAALIFASIVFALMARPPIPPITTTE
jgi:MFS family permease